MTMKFVWLDSDVSKLTTALFSGDIYGQHLKLHGLGQDSRSMVTKIDYRFLHIRKIWDHPEPNLTVFYSERLPKAFRDYAAHISITNKFNPVKMMM